MSAYGPSFEHANCRCPLVAVVICFAAGILCDRILACSRFTLLAGAGALLLLWMVGLRAGWTRTGACGALLLTATAGALQHHHFQRVVPENDIGRYLSDERKLVRMRAVLMTQPQVVQGAAKTAGSMRRPRGEYSRCVIRCEGLRIESGEESVSGLMQMVLSGRLDLTCIGPGDELELTGWVTRPAAPDNPGQHDFRRQLQAEGLRGLLRVEHPDLITVLRRDTNVLRRLRNRLRLRCELMLEATISPQTLPLAEAMLLGIRSEIDRDVRTHFVESGTAHLLAISGLHVGILAAFILALSRIIGLRERWSIPCVLLLLAAYVAIAESRPPMIRAYVLVAVWSLSRWLRRPLTAACSLSAAGLIVLCLNPSSLFDVGAQLSFLAVATILWLDSLRRAVRRSRKPERQSDSPLLMPRWRRWFRPVLQRSLEGCLISGAISFISAPLIASTFHVVSLAGVLVNVPLIPLVGAGLCCGFTAMLTGLVSGTAALVPAWLFDISLHLLLWSVELSAAVPGSHWRTVSPPGWWLTGFYLAVAGAMFMTFRRIRPQWLGVILSLWVIFGLTIVTSRPAPKELRCTVLSVGHGLCVLIELPGGRTMVYDAGCLSREDGAAGILQDALFAAGRTTIDLLLISHADADHYNGVPRLLESVPIDALCLSRHFPDAAQPGTLQVCDAAVAHGTTLQWTAAGERLLLDPDVDLRVLHPRADCVYQSDNASSIVLELQYQQQRILLTGDLEGDGLVQLLQQPMRRVDVLLAPHHGSRAASPPDLARWAVPRFVVASCGHRVSLETLQEVFGPATVVFATSRDGAVEFTLRGRTIETRTWARPQKETSEDAFR